MCVENKLGEIELHAGLKCLF